MLKAAATTAVLAFTILGLFAVPAMARGVTVGYTVYVNFIYPLHFLYNLQVTIYDQAGRVVATGMSPDGSTIVIPVRTESPIISLSASALGYASGPLTNYVANPAFWVVTGRSTVPVEVTGGDYWITIVLST
jgi:hypothetical protein